jgi:hypothetical protein
MMIGKMIKLLLPAGRFLPGDVGLIVGSCGCAVPKWTVRMGATKDYEIQIRQRLIPGYEHYQWVDSTVQGAGTVASQGEAAGSILSP